MTQMCSHRVCWCALDPVTHPLRLSQESLVSTAKRSLTLRHKGSLGNHKPELSLQPHCHCIRKCNCCLWVWAALAGLLDISLAWLFCYCQKAEKCEQAAPWLQNFPWPLATRWGQNRLDHHKKLITIPWSNHLVVQLLATGGEHLRSGTEEVFVCEALEHLAPTRY